MPRFLFLELPSGHKPFSNFYSLEAKISNKETQQSHKKSDTDDGNIYFQGSRFRQSFFSKNNFHTCPLSKVLASSIKAVQKFQDLDRGFLKKHVPFK